MSFSTLLNSTAAVSRVTRTASTYSAAGTEAWANVANWPCSIQPVSGRESLQYAKMTSNVSHTAYGDVIDIRTSDRLVSAGRTYEVVAVMDAAGRGHHLEVLLNYVDER